MDLINPDLTESNKLYHLHFHQQWISQADLSTTHVTNLTYHSRSLSKIHQCNSQHMQCNKLLEDGYVIGHLLICMCVHEEVAKQTHLFET